MSSSSMRDARRIVAERFLVSLVKFMEPIVRGLSAQSEAGLETFLNMDDLDGSRLAEKTEGRELVNTLVELITGVQPEGVITRGANDSASDPQFFIDTVSWTNSTNSQVESNNIESQNAESMATWTNISENETVVEGNPFDEYNFPFTAEPTEENLESAIATIPKYLAKTDLETMILTKVRWHVFNRMPIRLLAFDAEGNGLQLLGRDEIFSLILPKIYADMEKPSFLTEWESSENDSNNSRNSKEKTQKVLLESIIESNARYAILSHTWIRNSPGDVVFKDWDARRNNKEGYAKVTEFCRVSAVDHLVTFGWIDSICINKDSSAELDESIRSMYKWYRRAHVCVTYLSETRAITEAHRDSWFTRGWTLQELLAPAKTCFYNWYWHKLGFTSQRDIAHFIKTQTSIKSVELGLCQQGKISRLPISRRLELACGRQVTREEDTAYSLMGILGVDIPTAYGEGAERAIFRLLRELLNTEKNILDLFNRSYDLSNSLIPSSLELFSGRTSFFDQTSSNYGSSAVTLLDQYQPAEPIVLTHLGVRIPLLLVPALMTPDPNDPLYIPFGSLSGKAQISLPTEDSGKKQYTYNLLDERLYADNLAPLRTLEDEFNRWYLIGILAVFNFALEGDDILLPKWCISLPLRCDGSKPWKIESSNDVRINPWPTPVFQLIPAQHKLRLKIPKSELLYYGLQLVTLYL